MALFLASGEARICMLVGGTVETDPSCFARRVELSQWTEYRRGRRSVLFTPCDTWPLGLKPSWQWCSLLMYLLLVVRYPKLVPSNIVCSLPKDTSVVMPRHQPLPPAIRIQVHRLFQSVIVHATEHETMSE